MKFTELVHKFSDSPLAHGNVRCFGTSRTLPQVGEPPSRARENLEDFFLCYLEDIVEHNLGVTKVSRQTGCVWDCLRIH